MYHDLLDILHLDCRQQCINVIVPTLRQHQNTTDQRLHALESLVDAQGSEGHSRSRKAGALILCHLRLLDCSLLCLGLILLRLAGCLFGTRTRRLWLCLLALVSAASHPA
jgi:hypothetical protein